MNSYLDYMFIINNISINLVFIFIEYNDVSFLEFQQKRLRNLGSPTSQQLFQHFYNVSFKKFHSRSYWCVNQYLFYYLDSIPSVYSPILFNTYLKFCAISFRFYLDRPFVNHKFLVFFIYNENEILFLQDFWQRIYIEYKCNNIINVGQLPNLVVVQYDYQMDTTVYKYIYNNKQSIWVTDIWKTQLFDIKNLSTHMLKIKR